MRIHRIAEGSEIATQAAHGDTDLVDTLGLAKARLRIVADDSHQGIGDAGGDDIGQAPVGRDGLRCDLRGGCRARAERAHDLRNRLCLGCAGGSKLVGERLQVNSVDERLDLELAEARHDPTALDDGHLVIGDLRDRCLVGDEVDAAPAGAERRDGGQGLARV